MVDIVIKDRKLGGDVYSTHMRISKNTIYYHLWMMGFEAHVCIIYIYHAQPVISSDGSIYHKTPRNCVVKNETYSDSTIWRSSVLSSCFIFNMF